MKTEEIMKMYKELAAEALALAEEYAGNDSETLDYLKDKFEEIEENETK